MIAPRELPEEYLAWNRTWRSPYGRTPRLGPLGRIAALDALYRGPFAFQPNNTTRRFEFPWAYAQVAARGRGLDVVEIGGGLSGLQFVLAKEGHRVTNVDPGLEGQGQGWRPGMGPQGKGWWLDGDKHRWLGKLFGAPVRLIPEPIGRAGLADASADILLSVSVLEHFAPADLAELAEHLPRVLRQGGVVVLTIDLFLDVAPFTDRGSNMYGTNVDVRDLLDRANLELVQGNPAELRGFPEFSPRAVQAKLFDYMIGEKYPAMAQCLVARPKAKG